VRTHWFDHQQKKNTRPFLTFPDYSMKLRSDACVTYKIVFEIMVLRLQSCTGLKRFDQFKYILQMGLGKTLQAIATAYYYKAEWPLLIVVPASLKYQWVEELEKWLPELQPTDINIINNSSDVGYVMKLICTHCLNIIEGEEFHFCTRKCRVTVGLAYQNQCVSKPT